MEMFTITETSKYLEKTHMKNIKLLKDVKHDLKNREASDGN